MYTSSMSTFMASLRTHFVTNYKDWQGVAYIQWATADITQIQGAESVIYVTDTAVGYPEMSFFKSNLFLPNIMPAYQTMFADIVLYNDTRDGDVNYEYLFNLTNSTGGDEPEPSSLFNVDTLKQLISLGQNTKDIVNDTSGNADLNLDSWTELTTTLGLADNRQTYMIWEWLFYCNKITVNREPDGGNVQIGLLATEAGVSVQDALGIMQAELPVIIYAY
jgi:hypothetical protein